MDNGKYYPLGEKVAIRSAFGPAFLELARDNRKLVVVTADLGGSLNLVKFGEEYPDRYFNCGVAETNMIGICAGPWITCDRASATTGLTSRSLAHMAAYRMRRTVRRLTRWRTWRCFGRSLTSLS